MVEASDSSKFAVDCKYLFAAFKSSEAWEYLERTLLHEETGHEK